MDATDEGTEQNGGGPSGAEAAKTQPQASQKQQQQPRPSPKVVTKAKTVGSKAKQSNILGSFPWKEKDFVEEELEEPREILMKIGQRKLAIWPYDQ